MDLGWIYNLLTPAAARLLLASTAS
jgi:hypothetical protein